MLCRFPLYYQQEQEDCGPTCLQMILKFYGVKTSLDAVKLSCGNLKNGLTLLQLNHVAQRIGFKTKAVKLSMEELLSLPQDAFPFIAYGYEGHFIVIYKIKSNTIYTADPALGRINYNLKEFSKVFFLSENRDGFALLLQHEKITIPKTSAKMGKSINLNVYIREQLRYVILSTLFMAIIAGMGVLLPYLTQAVVDKGVNAKDIDTLVLVLIAMITLAISRTICGFFQSRIILTGGSLINIKLTYDVLKKMSVLPMRLFLGRQTGDILKRTDDVARIGNYLTTRIGEMVLSSIMFLVYAIVLYSMFPKLLFVFGIGAILYILYIICFLRRRKVLDYMYFRISSHTQEELLQYIRGMTEIRLADAVNNRLGVWHSLQQTLLTMSRKRQTLSQTQQLGGVLIFQIVDVLVIYISACGVIDGVTTLGTMMAVQYVVGNLEMPVRDCISFIQESQDVRIALKRVNYLVSSDTERTGGCDIGNKASQPPHMTIKNVTFKYDINSIRPAVSCISADIQKGKTTALVGMSGCGKTTLIKLLLGFYTPDKGEIYINDISMKSVDLKKYRAMAGAVMQDGYIFSDTIIRNVALSDETPDVERIRKALKVACADFINDLPMGLNTKIGVEGTSLSTGQKQRIQIARAVYKNPQLFLFDEATNALDTINEAKIYENLKGTFVGKTVIIAAHRLSTVCDADQILVFDHGEIVERGTHEELLELNGKYTELVKKQRFV